MRVSLEKTFKVGVEAEGAIFEKFDYPNWKEMIRSAGVLVLKALNIIFKNSCKKLLENSNFQKLKLMERKL